MLQLAASLDQVSPHVLAAAIVRAARDRGLGLDLPTRTDELAGSGIRGTVGGRDVAVGKASWVGVHGDEPWVNTARQRSRLDGAVCVFVGVDGAPAGALLLIDPIRPDAARTIRSLRRAGIQPSRHGDRRSRRTSPRTVGAMIGVDDVVAEQTPADKVTVVQRESARGSTIMVGDGVNDAPALALAAVGVAIGARGCHRVVRGRRRRAHRRSTRPPRRGPPHRPPLAAHRDAERRRRHDDVARRHGHRRGRLPARGMGRAAARSHRRRGDPQRAPQPRARPR